MRRPVTYAPKIALDWIRKVINSRGEKIFIQEKNEYQLRVSIKCDENL